MIDQRVWNAADLSFAAYATLHQGATSEQIDELRSQDFTATEAADFASRFPTVVAQFGDATGLSATVFQDSSGNITLAFRGTELQTNDLRTDGNIFASGAGYDQIVSMANWWRRSSARSDQLVQQYRLVRYPSGSAPEGTVLLYSDGNDVVAFERALAAEGTGELLDALRNAPGGKVNVTGHSLGGHLAMAFSSLFAGQSGQVTVFNAPGFIDNATNQAFFGKLGGSIPNRSDILNVMGDEALVGERPFRGIARLWSQPGELIDVPIENQWSSDEPRPFTTRNHSITPIVDALAVYKLLADLAPGVSTSDFKAILNQAAQGTSASLERIVDCVQDLFGVSADALSTGNGNREDLYKAIFDLRQKPSYNERLGLLQISPTPDTSSDVLNEARSGPQRIAYRYALKNLSPLVVLGDSSLFDAQNTKGELQLYDAVNSPGGLTSQWLEDRAAFLERKLYITSLDLDKYYQSANSDPGQFLNALDDRGKAYQGEAKDYEDRGFWFRAASGDTPNSLRHFIFGSDQSEFIQGAGLDDHLYGAAGADVLIGRKGDDRLEGGIGFDTYSFVSGDGDDIVLDADGKGILVLDGRPVTIGIKQSDTQWSQGSTTFTVDGADLRITFGAAPDTLTLKDFDFAKAWAAYYDGVRLISAPVVPTNFMQAYVGDTHAEKNDTLSGTPGNESFATGDGDDIVYADGAASATSANGGDDLIEAGADRDTVLAGGGKDWVEGGEGGDILDGNAGDDTVYGDTSLDRALGLDAAISAGENASPASGAGDLLSGDAGDDFLIGPDTSDLLLGGSGRDVFVGGGGDDTIYGDGTLATATFDWTATRTVTQGGAVFSVALANATIAGNDTAGDIDIVYGGAGDDWVFAGYGDDYAEGGPGNDALFGEQGSDTLFAGEGDDVLVGDNVASGGAASSGNDYLDGGAGKDYLQGDGGDDILIGGSGDDVLAGGTGKDTYIFGVADGRDQIFDDSIGTEASVLVFGEGFNPSALTIKPGSMVLDFGGVASIELASFNHFDPNAPAAFESLVFADGTTLTFQDVLNRGFTITGTQDNDNGGDPGHPMLVGTAFKDSIYGLAGNDFIAGLQGDDFLDGDAGADQLQGGDGNDELHGGEGDDALFGMVGDDYLDGGTGNDWLLGGPGNDTYGYGAGDTAYDVGGQATISFGAGISASDVVLRRQRTAYHGVSVFSVALKSELTDFEQIAGALPEHSLGITLASDDQLNAFSFADGTVLDHAALLRQTWADPAFIVGSAEDDTLEGYAGNDLLRGDDGDDVLRGFAGDDSLEAGSGNDMLEGASGSDSLLAGAGNDTLIGGTGADQLAGGTGSDLYLVSRGDGDDVIFEAGDGSDVDVLRFTDVAFSEVSLSHKASGDLVVSIIDGGSVTISGYYNSASTKIERLEFSDAEFVGSSYLDMLSVPPIRGTAGDDLLVGTSYQDTIQGGAGDDTLDGGGGDDVLTGGPGVDTYFLRPNAGADLLIEDGSERSIIQLATGWSFADIRTARQADDLVLTLRNGNSSVALPGYYVGQADWVVRDFLGGQKTVAQLLDYLANIAPPTTVSAWRQHFIDAANQQYQTYLARFGANGGVTIDDQGFSNAPLIYRNAPYSETGSYPTFHLNIADIRAGSSANIFALRGSDSVIADAGAGDDLIDNQGQAFVGNPASIGSFLYGADGSDTILGTWQADTLLGGSGDNYLAGSDGNDTYVVLSSDAGTTLVDEVNDYVSIGAHTAFAGGRNSTDTLVFADIPYSSVSIREGQFDTTATSPSGYGQLFGTLDFSWGTGAVVRLLMPDPTNPYLAEFTGESYGVESIKFSDGVTIPQSSLLNLVNRSVTTGVPGSDATEADTDADGFVGASFNQKTTLLGLEGDDFVSGGSQNDVLDGGPGNDYLYDDYGDDVLIGGEGDDRLRGSWGNDVLDGGPGNDLLEGGPGSDVYLFDPGFGHDYIHDDTLPFRIDTDTVRFGEGISPSDVLVTRDDNDLYFIVGSDRIDIGFVFFSGIVNNPFQYSGVETVEFSDGTVWSRDEMFARITTVPPTELDDPVYGSGAVDSLHGLAGNDRMLALSGDDVIYGDEGDDYLQGDSGYDILIGGAGNDVIDDEATPQTNFIHAGAGDDTVYVSTSRNFVIGGAGSDWIDNYAPDSVIAFNRGDGQDTVWCAADFTLSLGGGIAANDLTLEADGRDVILGTGSDDYVRLARRYESDQLYPWPDMRLQVIGDQARVHDLKAVVDYFSQQVQTQPSLVLHLGSVLPSYQLQSTLDQAYGGDLAYAYAKGRLDENVARATVLTVITDPTFGAGTQIVTNPDGPALTGGEKSSVMLGTKANEQITAGAGDDWVNAGAGNDTLIGGEGNDLLFGGPGSDTYLYSVGDGTDTVFDPDGENTVVFGTSIDSSMISLGVGSLFVRVGTGGVHFESFDPNNPYGPRDADRFIFADGTTLTYEALIDRGFDLFGTPNSDFIAGTATTDRVHGGRGDDLLAGAHGDDTYFYEPGDGADTIVEPSDPSALDVLEFGADIAPASVDVARSGDDLLVTFATPGDRLTLKDWYGVSGPGIESVRFFDGTVWDADYLEAHAQTNRPPVLARPIGDRRVDEDAPFAFTLPADTFGDADSGDTLAYSAELTGGAALPAWLAFDNGRFSGVPANVDVGRYDIQLTATDHAGATASDQFTLTVENINDAPLAYDDAAATDEDTPVAVTVAALLANDKDDDVGDAITIASVPQNSAAGGYVTLLAADDPRGFAPRVLYDPGPSFQHLPRGVHADDAFGYSIADAAGATSTATVHVSVIGLNDAPVALGDVASTQEDAFSASTGNVLANDRDVDDDAVLSVASTGTRAGRYGTLTLAMNGDYSYMLDNASSAVQSLRNGELLLDLFDYIVSDGIDQTAGKLTVCVFGANDAPLLVRDIPDASLPVGQAFTFRIAAGAFTDADAGDKLLFSATLADGGALPAWLSFDPATQSFSGTAQAGSFNLKVSAIDQAGAQASGQFTIHAGITVVGGSKNDHFSGTDGDDYLSGGAGNDQISGGAGNDILQGGSGNDALMNDAGNGLLDGGTGNDTLNGGAGNALYAGGVGNDVLHLGGGFNVVAFNTGDGKDSVYSSGGSTVLSLGGSGLDYARLRFAKSNDDLILNTGGGDQITFKGWYQGTDKQQIVDLQVVADAMASFDGASSESPRNSVEHFDFHALVHAFDTARATSGVTSWALSNALTQFHLGGSDAEAYGGDLAYWYGRRGNFAGISVAAAQQIIGATGFGADAQSLRPFVGLQEGFTKLS